MQRRETAHQGSTLFLVSEGTILTPSYLHICSKTWVWSWEAYLTQSCHMTISIFCW